MRPLSPGFRNSLEASASTELVLIFSTITHDDLTAPIRVVSEDQNGVSYKNGLVVNYRYGVSLFYGCPFKLELVTDDERPPRGKVSLPDPARRIGVDVVKLVESPKIKLEILKLSDFSDALDADNARNPVSTPYVEYSADYLFLRNVRGDPLMIEADLASYDMVGEPWPMIRSTQDRLPGLYR